MRLKLNKEYINSIYMEPKYYFSIGAVFKNEAHALDEWIQHYLMRGVDHIYLINDFSTDAFKPIIDKW